jgi:hypothetical protein
MREFLNRLLGRPATGFVYVPQDGAGAVREARPGAQVGKSEPPWIGVHRAPETVLITGWPARLWRVRIVRRAREQPAAYVRQVSAERVEILEEVPCSVLFGKQGGEVIKVLDAAAALTRGTAKRLTQARPAGGHAAYMRCWNRWLAKQGKPHPIADHHALLVASGSESPVGRGLGAVHDTVGRRAKALEGDAAFRIEGEDEYKYMNPPWDGASEALLHAALAMGAPEICESDAQTLLTAWRKTFPS